MIDTLKLTSAVTIIACSAALLVAFTQVKTGDRIAEQQRAIEQRALEAMVPAPAILTEYRIKPAPEEDSVSVWIAVQSSDTSYVFKVQNRGYAGVISYLVSVDTGGYIEGIIILDQHETPGRGGRIEEKRSDGYIWSNPGKKKKQAVSWFTEQFRGLSVRSKITIDRSAGEWHSCSPEVRASLASKNSITAITGATVSTRAVVIGLTAKARMYLKHIRGQV